MKNRSVLRKASIVAVVLTLGGVAATTDLSSLVSRANASPPAPAAPVVANAQSAPQPSPRVTTAPIAASPPIVDATRLSQAFTEVADHVSPSVVAIRLEARDERQAMPDGIPFGFFRGGPQQPEVQHGAGSGIIVASDGAILTNYHVVENATRIEVQLRDGRRFLARVVGADPATDLAVIRIDAQNLPAASFADSTQTRVGEWVVAIGSPLGLDYTVTAGVVSATGRGGMGMHEIEDFLQTDASINPGNSGGPLVNLRGEVLGINTMIAGRGTGIGFAVPASIAKNVTEQLLATGVVRRSQLGVIPQELTAELAASFGSEARSGVLVGEVSANGPAAIAGVQAGDIILSVDGQAVQSPRDLVRTITSKPVGSNVRLAVRRSGRAMTLEARTSERPSREARVVPAAPQPGQGRWINTPSGQLGFGYAPVDMNIVRQLRYRPEGRFVVTQVEAGSPAERAGLRAGDIVLEADQRPVTSPIELDRALEDGRVLLRIERRDVRLYTVVARDNLPATP